MTNKEILKIINEVCDVLPDYASTIEEFCDQPAHISFVSDVMQKLFDLKDALEGEDETPKASKIEEPSIGRFKNIYEIRKAFEKCKSSAEVQKIVKSIPSCFGNFKVRFYSSDGGFMVTYTYYDTKQGDIAEDGFWVFFAEGWQFTFDDIEI
jgi:hypothetical protein